MAEEVSKGEAVVEESEERGVSEEAKAAAGEEAEESTPAEEKPQGEEDEIVKEASEVEAMAEKVTDSVENDSIQEDNFGGNPFGDNSEEESAENAQAALEETSPSSDGEQDAETSESSSEPTGMSPLYRNIIFTIGAVVVLLVVASVYMAGRGRRQ
jgi:cobalamin biosynthesis Mg chelatase CobN